VLATDEPPIFLLSSVVGLSLVCSGLLTTPTPVSIIFFDNFLFLLKELFSLN
jgi:hypothetical protein